VRNPKRIKRILKKLEKYWMKNSDLRLGQIVANSYPNIDVFEMEDTLFESYLDIVNPKEK